MKKIDNSTMGGRIKDQRLKMGMTQEELAEKMFTTKMTISHYENLSCCNASKFSIVRKLLP